MSNTNHSRSWLPVKLRILGGAKGRSSLSLSGIARKLASDLSKNEISEAKQISNIRADLSRALHGRRNTPHLVAILEKEWHMPISEIRDLIREDRERKEAGNPITKEEALEFRRWWFAERFLPEGITREEQRERAAFAKRVLSQTKESA